MALTIRAATPADIPGIHTLAHEVWPKAYAEIITPEQVAYMLNRMYSPESLRDQMQSGVRFLIQEEALNTPVGFASFRWLQESDWKLDKLYVRSDRQQSGSGRALIERVLSEIKALGGHHLELQVNRRNNAVQFYHKLGFNILREADFDIGNGFYMIDYIMGIGIE